MRSALEPMQVLRNSPSSPLPTYRTTNLPAVPTYIPTYMRPLPQSNEGSVLSILQAGTSSAYKGLLTA